VQAVKEYGYILFLGGVVVTLTPLIAGLFFGRYVLKLNPALLLGGIAGRPDDDCGRRCGAREIRQPSGHTRLLVHGGIRSYLSDDLGHHHRLAHDLTEVMTWKTPERSTSQGDFRSLDVSSRLRIRREGMLIAAWLKNAFALGEAV